MSDPQKPIDPALVAFIQQHQEKPAPPPAPKPLDPQLAATIQRVFATRQTASGKNTLDRKVCPIVFLPGVMGSRLKLGSNAPWDPDSVPNMLHWWWRSPASARALLGVDCKGEVMSTMSADALGDRQSEVELYGKTLGWAGVTFGAYGVLLLGLHDALNGPYPYKKSPLAARAPACGDPAPLREGVHDWRYPIHAVGYDWRVDIRESAKAVAAEIDRIRKLHGQKVILVTHSMGGLVGRAACALSGAAANVRGVVHVVQPVNGAVIAYRRFIDGMWVERHFFDSQIVESNVFAGILGGDRLGYTIIMSGMVAPMQLLPNHLYKGWLTDKDGKVVDAKTIYQVLRGKEMGIFSDLSEHVDEAKHEDEQRREMGIVFATGSQAEIDSAKQRVAAARRDATAGVWGVYQSDLEDKVARHEDFHTKLLAWVHPQTFVLYAGGLATDSRYDWSHKGSDRIQILPREGDSTVPRASAVGLDAAVKASWECVSMPPGPAMPALSVDTGALNHQNVFKGPGVVDQVLDRVKVLQHFA